jgi:RNA polymerase sigma-70 factor (ECF subfamily)
VANDEFNTDLMHSCIDKWLAGEPAAADRMLRAAARRLELIARSSLRRFPTVSRWEGAEDILQGAVIRMIRTLHVVRPPNTRVFYHLAATHIRRELLDLARKYRQMVAPPAVDGSASWMDKLAGGDQPDRASEIDNDLASWEAFHEAVERLPTEEREVIGLVFYHGWTHKKIAELFHVDERTVRRWWKAANEKLQVELRDQKNPLAHDDDK